MPASAASRQLHALPASPPSPTNCATWFRHPVAARTREARQAEARRTVLVYHLPGAEPTSRNGWPLTLSGSPSPLGPGRLPPMAARIVFVALVSAPTVAFVLESSRSERTRVSAARSSGCYMPASGSANAICCRSAVSQFAERPPSGRQMTQSVSVVVKERSGIQLANEARPTDCGGSEHAAASTLSQLPEGPAGA
jgi:hypothetical protein